MKCNENEDHVQSSGFMLLKSGVFWHVRGVDLLTISSASCKQTLTRQLHATLLEQITFNQLICYFLPLFTYFQSCLFG